MTVDERAALSCATEAKWKLKRGRRSANGWQMSERKEGELPGSSLYTHVAASHRSWSAPPSSTGARISIMIDVSLSGERKTSWLSGTWRMSLEGVSLDEVNAGSWQQAKLA